MEEALEKMIDLKSDLAAQCIRRLQVLFFMGSFPDGNTPYISQPQTCDKNDICNQLFIITELKICHLSIHQSLISSEISKNTNLHLVFWINAKLPLAIVKYIKNTEHRRFIVFQNQCVVGVGSLTEAKYTPRKSSTSK